MIKNNNITRVLFNNTSPWPECNHYDKRGHAPACNECQKKYDKEGFESNATNRDERAAFLSIKIQENLDKGMDLCESIRCLLEQRLMQ